MDFVILLFLCPKVILNEKRRRRPAAALLYPGETACSSTSNNESSASDEADGISDPPSDNSVDNIYSQGQSEQYSGSNLGVITKQNNIAENTHIRIFEKMSPDETAVTDINRNTIQPNDITVATLATDQQVEELKVMIEKLSSIIQEQSQKIVSLTDAVSTLSSKLKRRNLENVKDLSDVRASMQFKETVSLPLETITSVEELEASLKDQNVAVEFKSFLLQLGGNNLKTSVKVIIRELYSLILQGKMNYSGREGKYCTRGLRQTQIVIEVMQLNSGKTQAEAIDEYMYHMQHVSDRVRSAKSAATRATRNVND